jgi:pyruvate,water dikinase
LYVVKQDEASSEEEFGFKAAALADMQKSALPVPRGFVISPKALDLFISRNGLEDKIRAVSQTSDKGMSGLEEIEKNTRELFANAFIPEEVKKEVLSAYGELSLSDDVRRADTAALDLIRAGRNHERVAVRSSVLRNPENSFAGVAGAFLNVSGEDDLWSSIKMCWASVFYPYALLYSERKGVEGLPRMSIVVQRMVDSEKCGAMLSNFGNDKMLVEASWGLGSAVSSGIVAPDEYLLEKNGALIEKNISKKHSMYVRNPMSGKTDKEHVPGSKMDVQVLTDSELRKLCELAEKAQGSKSGQYIMDWCIGRNRVFILDIKPGNYEISMGEDQAGDVLVTGRCASQGIASGRVSAFPSEDGNHYDATSVVVSEGPSIPLLVSFPDIAGYVTNNGGRLCNFSVLARELKIPVLATTQNATSILKDGDGVKILAEQGKVIAVQQEPAPAVQEETAPAVQEEPMKADLPITFVEPESGEVAAESHEKTLIGTKIFARLSPGMVESIGGVDGYVLSGGGGDPGAAPVAGGGTEGIQSLGSADVWLHSMGEHDFPNTVETAKRLDESGFTGAGLLIPVLRGVNDVDRWRHQVPAGARLGVSIRTPAMAMAAGSIIKEGIQMANIELKSLIQLSMGLQKPEPQVHQAVIDLVSGVTERCHEVRAKVCISMEPDHMTGDNVESVLRLGVDILCVEPSMIGTLKDTVARAEKKILLESGAVKKEAEAPPVESRDQQVSTVDVLGDVPGSDDFNPSSSFLT